jgi:hypothetical protein
MHIVQGYYQACMRSAISSECRAYHELVVFAKADTMVLSTALISTTAWCCCRAGHATAGGSTATCQHYGYITMTYALVFVLSNATQAVFYSFVYSYSKAEQALWPAPVDPSLQQPHSVIMNVGKLIVRFSVARQIAMANRLQLCSY